MANVRLVVVGDGDIRNARHNKDCIRASTYYDARCIIYFYVDERRDTMIGIILLGKSNSGKSTLGKVVARKTNARYISSGDIARSMTDNLSSLNKGNLAPESEMRSAILDAISSEDTSFILDGFPRFYEQYEWLNQVVNCDLIYVIISVPSEQIISRAINRGRSDDRSIRSKLEFYEENTKPMIKNIIDNGEIVYDINNDNDADIQGNISTLCRIMEDYLC